MNFRKTVKNIFDTVVHIIQNITIVDILDILLVAIILYYVFKFIRDRRAGKLAAGVVFVVAFLVFSELVGMRTMQFFFQNIFQVGVIALVILFQPEFRSMLEKVGANPIKGIKSIGESKREDSLNLAIREVVSAASEMAASKTGALIVFQRSTMLGDVISTGTVIDAQVNSFLIRNVFYNKAPLHDGAMVIVDSRVHAAGCLLPLSAQDNINKDLGTRHRAAIGMSENSDAVVVVISEETGVISIAVDGVLRRGFTSDTLREKLVELLIADTASNQKPFHRSSKKHPKNERSVKNNEKK